ncbi:hypothetical protein V6N12_068464 [Hibiscus sabdariffa]|uniref:Uncharacterized protein n=1 Tax=Hibiscus sabdariffa TaxID=183260 RepID=A0ABR2FQ95_9ROSI
MVVLGVTGAGWSVSIGVGDAGASIGAKESLNSKLVEIAPSLAIIPGGLWASSSSSLAKLIGEVEIYCSRPLGSCPYPWLSFMVGLVVTTCSSSYRDGGGLSIFMGLGGGLV